MIRTPIPDEDMQVLREERFTHPHPRVQRKMEAVYLTGRGLPRQEVARLLGVTVRSYLANYRDAGIEGLCRFNPHPQSAALGPHTTTIQEAFIAEPPHTVPEAVNRIEKLTGIRRSEPPVRPWLKNGFGHRKTGPIPAKADPVAQELFLDTQLSPALKEAPSGPAMSFLSTRPILSWALGSGTSGVCTTFSCRRPPGANASTFWGRFMP